MGRDPERPAGSLGLDIQRIPSVSLFPLTYSDPRNLEIGTRYFRKFEKYSPSREFPDVDVTLRGAEGLVNSAFSSISQMSLQAHERPLSWLSRLFL